LSYELCLKTLFIVDRKLHVEKLFAVLCYCLMSNSAFKTTRIYCNNGIIQEYTCKRYCYNAVNTSIRTEQYLTAHKETNYTDDSKWICDNTYQHTLKQNNTNYGHTSTNHVRLPGLEGREINSRLPGTDTLRKNYRSLANGPQEYGRKGPRDAWRWYASVAYLLCNDFTVWRVDRMTSWPVCLKTARRRRTPQTRWKMLRGIRHNDCEFLKCAS